MGLTLLMTLRLTVALYPSVFQRRMVLSEEQLRKDPVVRQDCSLSLFCGYICHTKTEVIPIRHIHPIQATLKININKKKISKNKFVCLNRTSLTCK